MGDRFLTKKLGLFYDINPNNFYVENIRSYYGMSYFVAKRLCDEAVNNGEFDKKIGLECPSCHRIIKYVDNTHSIHDESITCEICEAREKETYTFSMDKLRRIDSYSLHKV